MSERERFLPPVKVDPGWETVANGGTDRTGDMEQVIKDMESNPPKDRYVGRIITMKQYTKYIILIIGIYA